MARMTSINYFFNSMLEVSNIELKKLLQLPHPFILFVYLFFPFICLIIYRVFKKNGRETKPL